MNTATEQIKDDLRNGTVFNCVPPPVCQPVTMVAEHPTP